jgi:hypothetical protein
MTTPDGSNSIRLTNPPLPQDTWPIAIRAAETLLGWVGQLTVCDQLISETDCYPSAEQALAVARDQLAAELHRAVTYLHRAEG